ncbi:hypothetical protein CEUSTIGMA_g1888.t1 [Chlamydomonas eustigma]|uniref:Uncharacterized protein n=1 Tax=Chlamydomonas eustigma TaxID=1157962 RepID=A0A250WUQ0_9CHLO|nr:hypothetical protein CEUSTIGMA_g1888.t1 [Chlamydomonas eustigma]|eukprot:GAX74439.1 hypothetical protein CEUSTIGMA_g1888.t1 [Chlamydomonas eustigma]
MIDGNKPDLAARLEAVFGGLGTVGNSQSDVGAQTWSLQLNIPAFHTGAANLDVYSSDEEAERSAPRPFPLEYSEDEEDKITQGLRSDEDGILPRPSFGEERRQEELFLSSCSAQFRKAFEAEEEEDEYDRVAVGSSRSSLGANMCSKITSEVHLDALGKPASDTEVPEDNIFDRMMELRQSRLLTSNSNTQSSTQQPLAPNTISTELHPGAIIATALASEAPQASLLLHSSRIGGRMSWAQRMMAEASAASAAAGDSPNPPHTVDGMMQGVPSTALPLGTTNSPNPKPLPPLGSTNFHVPQPKNMQQIPKDSFEECSEMDLDTVVDYRSALGAAAPAAEAGATSSGIVPSVENEGHPHQTNNIVEGHHTPSLADLAAAALKRQTSSSTSSAAQPLRSACKGSRAAVVQCVPMPEGQAQLLRQTSKQSVRFSEDVKAGGESVDNYGGSVVRREQGGGRTLVTAAVDSQKDGSDSASSACYQDRTSRRPRGGLTSRVRAPIPDYQRRGFVPDHVRNPERYIVYILDETLTVGAGDQSTSKPSAVPAAGATGSGRGMSSAAQHQGAAAAGRVVDEMDEDMGTDGKEQAVIPSVGSSVWKGLQSSTSTVPCHSDYEVCDVQKQALPDENNSLGYGAIRPLGVPAGSGVVQYRKRVHQQSHGDGMPASLVSSSTSEAGLVQLSVAAGKTGYKKSEKSNVVPRTIGGTTAVAASYLTESEEGHEDGEDASQGQAGGITWQRMKISGGISSADQTVAAEDGMSPALATTANKVAGGSSGRRQFRVRNIQQDD